MVDSSRVNLKLINSLSIDRAVFFAVATKIWSMGSGLITSLLIASFFSSEIQGFYYTFMSVLALQVFAELGLGVVISASASHEWANLSLDAHGRVVGDAEAKSKLASLGRFAMRWYVVAGSVASVGLMVGGFVFFGSTNWKLVSMWGPPWIALCIVNGVNLCCMPVWALLEGCNQVKQVYAYRFFQSVATGLASWLAIYLGAELWVASIVGVVIMLVLLLTVGRKYTFFVKEVMLSTPLGAKLDWRKDILPMQWRISVSWLSGYLTFSLFTPILFHYQGAQVAGQMGMTWAFIGALTGVASSWVAPKAPTFAILIARQKYAELDKMFWQLTATVVGITVVGALAIWALVLALNVYHHPYAVRLLSPKATAYFLIATILLVATLPMSTYLRAHKKEPLFLISIASGILTSIAVFITGRYYSIEVMAIAYLCVMGIITPFVVIIWHKSVAKWHTSVQALSLK